MMIAKGLRVGFAILCQKGIGDRNAIHFGTRIADLECNPFEKDFDDDCLGPKNPPPIAGTRRKQSTVFPLSSTTISFETQGWSHRPLHVCVMKIGEHGQGLSLVTNNFGFLLVCFLMSQHFGLHSE